MHKITEVDVSVVEIDIHQKLGEQIVNLMKDKDEDNNGNNGKDYLWKEAKGYQSNFDYIEAEIDKNDEEDEDDYTRIDMAVSELVDRIKVYDQNYYVFGDSCIQPILKVGICTRECWIVALPYAHLN
jgi:hypothetical protein